MKTELEKYWGAYCEGDQQAFEKVFTILFDPLFFKVLVWTKEREAAKDIVQEALIKLYQNQEPSAIRDIRGWTSSVAYNLFISERRKVQTIRKYEQRKTQENLTFSPAPSSFPDNDNFINILKKYLSSTDFKLLQLEMKGYQIPEIATMLNMQQKTVYNRRTKIRKFVAKIWKQLFIILIIFYL